MKNKSLSIAAAAMLIAAGLGCGVAEKAGNSAAGGNANTSANKSITEKAMDTAVGESKVGIPECDEAIDILAAQANDPDDNIVTKAAKATALKRFREEVKDRLEAGKADKAKVAKYCSDFRSNIERYQGTPETNKE